MIGCSRWTAIAILLYMIDVYAWEMMIRQRNDEIRASVRRQQLVAELRRRREEEIAFWRTRGRNPGGQDAACSGQIRRSASAQ